MSMNVAQTMEAVLKHAPIHMGHTSAHVRQVSLWLLMESPA